MSKYTYASLAPFLALVVAECPAWAQATPDITDAINQGTRIEDALRERDRTTPRQDVQGEDEIDGEAGVFVLTVNDIFYVAGAVGGGWAENPLRTIDDVGDSFYANAAMTAGIQTKLGGAVDFGLSTTVSGIEYEEAFAPSSRTLNASTNIGTPIKGTPLYIGASLYGGFSYDGSFSNGTGFYGANIQLSAGGPIGPSTLVRGSLTGGRSENEIDENDAWNAGLDVEMTQLVADDWTVTARGSVSRVWYDDFFEDVTFIPRRDWQYSANVGVNWAPLDWLGVGATFGYSKRDSGFFLSDYDGLEGALTVTARKRF